ncbi:MAG: class III cytochrome C family protein [Desulfobacterales bacterium]|nr:MAG: class III cytochrome C family protein [Desulfobacterales bacterium]
MKRSFIAASCLVVLVMTTDTLAQEPPHPLELPTGNMTLMAPEGSGWKAKRSPVHFPHSLHFGFPCKDCHHTWDGASPVKSCSTSGCHENFWAPLPGTASQDKPNIKSLTGAFHKACRDCHRNEVKIQKTQGIKEIATGPIDCEGCHPTPHSEIENSEEHLAVPLGNLVIRPPEGVAAKKAAVNFPHGQHFEFACQTCHHDWDGESEVESCISCHEELEPAAGRNINNPDNIMYYLAAYHKACLDCHRDTTKKRKAAVKAAAKAGKTLKAEDMPKAGPLGCAACHSES